MQRKLCYVLIVSGVSLFVVALTLIAEGYGFHILPAETETAKSDDSSEVLARQIELINRSRS